MNKVQMVPHFTVDCVICEVYREVKTPHNHIVVKGFYYPAKGESLFLTKAKDMGWLIKEYGSYLEDSKAAYNKFSQCQFFLCKNCRKRLGLKEPS